MKRTAKEILAEMDALKAELACVEASDDSIVASLDAKIAELEAKKSSITAMYSMDDDMEAMTYSMDDDFIEDDFIEDDFVEEAFVSEKLTENEDEACGLNQDYLEEVSDEADSKVKVKNLKEASARLDKLAEQVEASGDTRLAYEIDRIADSVDAEIKELEG